MRVAFPSFGLCKQSNIEHNMDFACVLNKTAFVLIMLKIATYLAQISKRLEPRVLPKQHHNMHCLVTLIRYNFGAKFPTLSAYSVIYLLALTTCDAIR